MNKTWILAEAEDNCFGICNHCLEQCVLNPNKDDNEDEFW